MTSCIQLKSKICIVHHISEFSARAIFYLCVYFVNSPHLPKTRVSLCRSGPLGTIQVGQVTWEPCDMTKFGHLSHPVLHSVIMSARTNPPESTENSARRETRPVRDR